MIPRRRNYAPLDLKMIREKCVEDGTCWIWQGAINQGMPVARDRDRIVNVRRHIAGYLRGEIVLGKLASTTCGTPRCCAPAHIEMVTRQSLQRKSALTLYHQAPARREKLAIAQRARSPLDSEMVAAIRASDLPGRDLAALYGVSLSTIQGVITHRTWQNYRNPFAGLMR